MFFGPPRKRGSFFALRGALATRLVQENAVQIRRRKNCIELIRIRYDAALGRSRSELLGCVPLETLTAVPALLATLTNGERLQLDRYLAPIRAATTRAQQADAAARLPELIAAATHWYLGAPPRDARVAALALATREAFSALLAAQVKAGVGRRRRRAARRSA